MVSEDSMGEEHGKKKQGQCRECLTPGRPSVLWLIAPTCTEAESTEQYMGLFTSAVWLHLKAHQSQKLHLQQLLQKALVLAKLKAKALFRHCSGQLGLWNMLLVLPSSAEISS